VTAEYLLLMLGGYALSVAVEGPILLLLLSQRHPLGARAFAGVWLTACTYPVVWLVLPPLFDGLPRWQFLLAAETFAPVAECVVFWAAFVRGRPADRRATLRDCGVIVLANLCSFGLGEALIARGWMG
jgi:hypothetical protein